MTTVAGSGSGTSVDGTGRGASFDNPVGIAYSATAQGAPTLFVTDAGSGFLRAVTLSSAAVVTENSTFFTPGQIFGLGVFESTAVNDLFVAANGSDYQISLPTTPNPTATPYAVAKALGTPATVAIDTTEDLFTTDASDGNFWEIVNGQVQGHGHIRQALSTALPAGGNFGLVVTGMPSTAYYTDETAGTLSSSTTTPDMATSTVLATGGALKGPAGMTLLGGDLYIANCGGNDIVQATTAGVLTVVAGSGSAAEADGTGKAASFDCPFGITNDGTNLYVTDMNGNTIREITNVP